MSSKLSELLRIRSISEEVDHVIAIREFHSPKTVMPEAAYQLIREKVKKAIGRIKDFKPYKLATPIQLDVRFKNYRPSEVLSYLSIVERTDAHRIKFTGKDIIEVSKFLSSL